MSFSNLLEAERARRYRRNHDSDEDDDNDDDDDDDGDGSGSDDVDGGDGDGSRDGEEEEEAVEAYEDDGEHARLQPRAVRKEGGADRRDLGKQRRSGPSSRLVEVEEEDEDEDNEGDNTDEEKEKPSRSSTRVNGALAGASSAATQGSRPSLALSPAAPTTRGLPAAPTELNRHRLASDEAGDEDEDDNDTVGDEDSVRYVHDTDRIGDFLHISPRPSAKEKSGSEGPSSSSSSSASSTSVGAVFTFAAADVGEQSSTSLTTVPRVPSSSTTVPAVTEGVETESMASRGLPLSQRAPRLEVEIDPREHELHPRAPSALKPTELAGSDDPGIHGRSPVEDDHLEDEDDFDDYVDEWDAQGNRVTSRASATNAAQPSSGAEASPPLPQPSLATASSFTAGMVLVPGPNGAWLWQSLAEVQVPEGPSTRIDTAATATSALLVGGVGVTISEPTRAAHTESLDARVRDAIGTVAPVARSVEHVREKPGLQLSSPVARIPSPLTSTRRRVRALDPEDEPEDAERPLEGSPARPLLGLTASPSTAAITTATTMAATTATRVSTGTKMTPIELEASSTYPAVRPPPPPSTAPSYTAPSSVVVDTSAIEMALGISLSPTSQEVFSVGNEPRPAVADGSVAGGLQGSRAPLPVPESAWPAMRGSWTAPEASDEDEFDAPSLGDLGYAAPAESNEGDEDEASPGATGVSTRNPSGEGVATGEDAGENEEAGVGESVEAGTSLFPDFAGSALVLRDPGFLDDVWGNDYDENPAESSGAALSRAQPSFAAPHGASPHEAVAALLSLRSEFATLRDRWLAVRAAEMELDETRVRAAEHVRALRARVADEAQAKLGVQARWLEHLGRDVRLLETNVGRVAADARAEGSPWARADHPRGGNAAMIEQ